MNKATVTLRVYGWNQGALEANLRDLERVLLENGYPDMEVAYHGNADGTGEEDR